MNDENVRIPDEVKEALIFAKFKESKAKMHIEKSGDSLGMEVEGSLADVVFMLCRVITKMSGGNRQKLDMILSIVEGASRDIVENKGTDHGA